MRTPRRRPAHRSDSTTAERTFRLSRRAAVAVLGLTLLGWGASWSPHDGLPYPGSTPSSSVCPAVESVVPAAAMVLAAAAVLEAPRDAVVSGQAAEDSEQGVFGAEDDAG